MPRRWGGIAAALALALLAAAYLATGYFTLDPASRNVPVLAASVTLVLLVLELLRQLLRKPAQGAGHGHTQPPARGAEIRVVASVAAGLIGVYLLGFLIALPLYLAGTIVLIGRRSWRTGLTTAVVTVLAIYVIFELVLSYRLFPGVLFE